MRSMTFFALLIATSTVLVATSAPRAAAEENWFQFRGPRGDGSSPATGLPLTWSETENIKWKTPIHGRAWSSPVVWGDSIWLTTATDDGKQMSLLCVDFETGRIIHDLLLFENESPRFRHETNSYASPTPILEEGRVYAHFGSYGTACLDMETAEVLWTRRDIESDDFRGPGSSPVLFGDLFIVNYDGFDTQFVIALDKNTGETVWKRDRDINYGTDNGDHKKAYGTPALIEVDGRMQLVSPAAVATIAYDPLTGADLWRVYHGGMNVSARPLFGLGMLYITAGDSARAMIAVRANGTGDVTDSHVAWQSSSSVAKRPSLLLIDDMIFMMNDVGIASCLDAVTGKTIWQKRLGGAYWASPLYADGRIYCFSQEGASPVFAPTREFKLLATNQLDDGFNASPAVVGQSLILRTYTHLYRVEE